MAGIRAREVPAAISGLCSQQPLDGGLNHSPWRPETGERERCLTGRPRSGRLSRRSWEGTDFVRWTISAKREQDALELMLVLLR